MSLKIGELARRTGLTVRTLHHWDRIGLLSPSARSRAGYRLYAGEDVLRLHRIVALRQLGLSLGEIARSLEGPPLGLARTLEAQVERLRARIEAERRLCERLERIAERAKRVHAEAAGAAEGVSAEDLLQAIEATIMFEKYYTPEQLSQLEARRQELGEAHIREVEAEWPRLIAAVRECMSRGADPTGDEVRPLARRWRELVREFTGGDAGIASSVTRMYQNEPAARERTGLDAELMAYVGQAMSAIGGW